MGKNSKDLNNSKIYQVRNNVNDDIYIGSTCQKLCKRMALYRQYSTSHDGLLYDEMRRLGKEQFYIELIEDYPCENNEQLTAMTHFYIRERSTLNKKANTDTTESQPDARHIISELKTLVHDLHARILHIEGKIDSFMNNGYSPGALTPTSNIEEDTETNAIELEILNIEEPVTTSVVEPVPSTVFPHSEEPEQEMVASTLLMFDIADADDVEVEKPGNIETYDLVERVFPMLEHKIPDELLRELEKLTTVMFKSNVEHSLHPNDKDREDVLEMAIFQHANLLSEAYAYYLIYKETNPKDETNVESDKVFNELFGKSVQTEETPTHKQKNKNKKRRNR
jgi:hypothetical protein